MLCAPAVHAQVAGTYYINNHIRLMIDYHAMESGDAPSARVVGFEVEPFSVKHTFQAGNSWNGVDPDIPPLATCDRDHPASSITKGTPQQPVLADEPVLYTYDVIWKASEVHWASRWDIYLSLDGQVPAKVHWFSILNSLLIVLFLTAMIGMILLRNLHRDITRYNRYVSVCVCITPVYVLVQM
jgi:transmembrane 9 superfamily member 2/4